MPNRTHSHGEPPLSFMLAFYAVLVFGCGVVFKAGWELMGWLLGT